MSEENQLERFYRLMYFSPRPEDEEKVCVAVLIKDGNQVFLEYDERFEKAKCIAADYSAESLKFILQTLRDKSEHQDDGSAALNLSFSPQFQLSAPRVLLQPANEQVREVLRHRFLLRVRPVRTSEKQKGIGRRIDRLLFEKIRIRPASMRRRVSFSELFGIDAQRSLPKDLIPKSVSRAVSFDNRVVLLDGVDLHAPSQQSLVDSIGRISHAFWQYQEARAFSKDLSSMRLTRAAILFDGEGDQLPDDLRWRRDYAYHELDKDSDITLGPGTSDSEENLREALQPVLADNL
ncbi:MAG TPA: hypothetical protein VGR84_06465 [Candidatus Acidoferrales bacterium]|nr:hypothetical protein [Candidatus Acidoferrales bacterium]